MQFSLLPIVDRLGKSLGWVLSLGLCSLMAIITAVLWEGSEAAREIFGVKFIISNQWNPAKLVFGAIDAIVGTLITSIMALCFALPLSFGISFFIDKLTYAPLKLVLTLTIELLSVIPSIIFGRWGLLVFVPSLGLEMTQSLNSWLGQISMIGVFFQGGKVGVNILAASIVLAIMIIPFITSCFLSAFELVPRLLKEASHGMSSTHWEVISSITIPYTFKQMVGGTILGLTRALGETMAVAFVIGNAHGLKISILEPGVTLASSLANEFTEADNALYTSSLVYLGLILFCITALSLLMSRYFFRGNQGAGHA